MEFGPAQAVSRSRIPAPARRRKFNRHGRQNQLRHRRGLVLSICQANAWGIAQKILTQVLWYGLTMGSLAGRMNSLRSGHLENNYV